MSEGWDFNTVKPNTQSPNKISLKAQILHPNRRPQALKYVDINVPPTESISHEKSPRITAMAEALHLR
jgi:hypothetical protein